MVWVRPTVQKHLSPSKAPGLAGSSDSGADCGGCGHRNNGKGLSHTPRGERSGCEHLTSSGYSFTPSLARKTAHWLTSAAYRSCSETRDTFASVCTWKDPELARLTIMKQFNSGSMVNMPLVLRFGVGLGCPDWKEAVPSGRTVTLIETGVFGGTWALGDPSTF